MELVFLGLAALFMVLSTFFFIVSGIGLVRLPDLYLRMSATSKASSLGAACAFLAGAFFFSDNPSVALRVFAGILFIFSTAPIGAHIVGRASYARNVPTWEGLVKDEMANCYDPHTRSFKSHPSAPSLAPTTPPPAEPSAASDPAQQVQ